MASASGHRRRGRVFLIVAVAKIVTAILGASSAVAVAIFGASSAVAVAKIATAIFGARSGRPASVRGTRTDPNGLFYAGSRGLASLSAGDNLEGPPVGFNVNDLVGP
jgi:hypothetical protein